jgi:hypothetical protein
MFLPLFEILLEEMYFVKVYSNNININYLKFEGGFSLSNKNWNFVLKELLIHIYIFFLKIFIKNKNLHTNIHFKDSLFPFSGSKFDNPNFLIFFICLWLKLQIFEVQNQSILIAISYYFSLFHHYTFRLPLFSTFSIISFLSCLFPIISFCLSSLPFVSHHSSSSSHHSFSSPITPLHLPIIPFCLSITPLRLPSLLYVSHRSFSYPSLLFIFPLLLFVSSSSFHHSSLSSHPSISSPITPLHLPSCHISPYCFLSLLTILFYSLSSSITFHYFIVISFFLLASFFLIVVICYYSF